jgi:hypothetical protein
VKTLRRLCLAALGIALSGCAPVRAPVPELSQPNGSGLGIEMVLKAPIGFLRFAPHQVFFARVDATDRPGRQEVIPSNYASGGRVYLLNAPPGTYVAVGALSVRDQMGRPARFLTFFSPELSDHTRVTVREAEFVFMGSYVIDQSVQSGLGEAILFGLGGEYRYRGTLGEVKKGAEAHNEFFKSAREDLAGRGWEPRLRSAP